MNWGYVWKDELGLLVFLFLDLDLMSEERIFYDNLRFCVCLKYELVEILSRLWELGWGREERGRCEIELSYINSVLL